jgi:hypothetical protein
MRQSVGDDGRSPGVALTEKRRFVRLIGLGGSNSEASRRAGANLDGDTVAGV